MTLRTLNYGIYGIFLIMGNAGFCPSTVLPELATAGLVTLRDRVIRLCLLEGGCGLGLGVFGYYPQV